jgi:hypothetical protein
VKPARSHSSTSIKFFGILQANFWYFWWYGLFRASPMIIPWLLMVFHIWPVFFWFIVLFYFDSFQITNKLLLEFKYKNYSYALFHIQVIIIKNLMLNFKSKSSLFRHKLSYKINIQNSPLYLMLFTFSFKAKSSNTKHWPFFSYLTVFDIKTS